MKQATLNTNRLHDLSFQAINILARPALGIEFNITQIKYCGVGVAQLVAEGASYSPERLRALLATANTRTNGALLPNTLQCCATIQLKGKTHLIPRATLRIDGNRYRFQQKPTRMYDLPTVVIAEYDMAEIRAARRGSGTLPVKYPIPGRLSRPPLSDVATVTITGLPPLDG